MEIYEKSWEVIKIMEIYGNSIKRWKFFIEIYRNQETMEIIYGNPLKPWNFLMEIYGNSNKL